MLPPTETPGALDLKVDIFMDRVFGELYDDQAQDLVRSELDQMQRSCTDKFGKNFAELAMDQRGEMINLFESSAGKFNGKVWSTPVGKQAPVGFYRSLKSMVLWGYFTTEQVGKEILSYDPIPGEYRGCIPVSEVGNVWSL
jgi:hypothetical protein